MNTCVMCGQECPEYYMYCWACAHVANNDHEGSYGIREILDRRIKDDDKRELKVCQTRK